MVSLVHFRIAKSSKYSRHLSQSNMVYGKLKMLLHCCAEVAET
jgi:hypothetical protein